MSISTSWIHGNTLVIESPLHFSPITNEQNGQLILTPYGWGAEVSFTGIPPVSWMHIPIPTLNEGVNPYSRFELRSVYFLFECSGADIRSVHIYDGFRLIQEYNDLYREGNYLVIENRNTFHLNQPHRVQSGISLSFLYAPHSGQMPPKLLVAAAGAKFGKRNLFLSTLLNRVSRLSP